MNDFKTYIDCVNETVRPYVRLTYVLFILLIVSLAGNVWQGLSGHTVIMEGTTAVDSSVSQDVG